MARGREVMGRPEARGVAEESLAGREVPDAQLIHASGDEAPVHEEEGALGAREPALESARLDVVDDRPRDQAVAVRPRLAVAPDRDPTRADPDERPVPVAVARDE